MSYSVIYVNDDDFHHQCEGDIIVYLLLIVGASGYFNMFNPMDNAT